MPDPFRGFGGQFARYKFGFQWQGFDVVEQNLTRYADNVQDYRRQVADRVGELMEQYAKSNHPWQNRTGLAERLLFATVVHDDARAISHVYLGHGIEYGYYLEVGHGGRFAIILPTIYRFAPIAMGTNLR